MRKILIGILLGALAGCFDLIPMLIQKLTWDANLSAFSMWVIIGFFITVTDIRLNGIIKGILISLLILAPSAIIIWSFQPLSIFPVLSMTVVLGGILGFTIERWAK